MKRVVLVACCVLGLAGCGTTGPSAQDRIDACVAQEKALNEAEDSYRPGGPLVYCRDQVLNHR